MTDAGKCLANIGSWDRHKAPPKDAFGSCRYEPGLERLTLIKSAFPGICAGNACVDSRCAVLYCTDETSTNAEFFGGGAGADGGGAPGDEQYVHGGGGRVFAFAIDSGTGDLTEINHPSSYGSLRPLPV